MERDTDVLSMPTYTSQPTYQRMYHYMVSIIIMYIVLRDMNNRDLRIGKTPL